MHKKKMISKKSPKCSLIVRFSFSWQQHIQAENGESNGYKDNKRMFDTIFFKWKYIKIIFFIFKNLLLISTLKRSKNIKII